DMQSHPPDILITNVSMLGAMLNREVDAPIFDKTRAWLTSHDDAYFHLVLDELHLQRGAAGTEVSYLVRLLLSRLGLADAAHRHKVRILASSASLPTEGEAGLRSQAFLWDMFGNFGTCTPGGQGAADANAWARTIVPGEVEPETPRSTGDLPTEPFLGRLWGHGGGRAGPAGVDDTPLHEPEWRGVANALAVASNGTLEELIREAIQESGRRLAAACWSTDDARARAVDVTKLSESLFGRTDDEGREALR